MPNTFSLGSIDIFHEELLSLTQACHEPALRRTDGRPRDVSVLYRHIKQGARANDGTRVRLETIRTPSGLRTSREAIARFIARLNGQEVPIVTPTPRLRKQQINAAEHELQKAGFITEE
ncbi:MAG TPA: hypothetical protein VGG19_02975 [Tepidisphaeraceae bacterium]|jgi:hypothetical protein